ncbi:MULTISPECIES: arginine N-succinyltransferase [Legionella]|uniref:Arginine N-succinyltransferase n=1 Tax=Legionella septentrionalis TaxID=2498109 RepID=A0A433JLM3_9GAMM|nr:MULTISPECIES: arginine N-succinyltransferase [Legionella]MCP0913443.1 arginine N-succinyltransferase [Legionella sp. 27cVA30]RUQ89779.1 arginine N-succinyltransferase [Legionella septentrionalis]RUQ99567.1 arginine N-succinyltransferase [Legionella septentrionalis]RUR09822.1 arginine N-succinyltransferase [Legionella septentrionalis]RUR13633.1 arginine N-succinyltransferase [Legionella septentrionalis]
MMLFRSAKEKDLVAICHLAEESGIGITTLPKDKELLRKRLSWATYSFNKTVEHPENEYYLFVIEDLDKKTVVGTSAIEAYIGHDSPFYSYKVSKRTRMCHSLNIRTDYEVLSLVNDYQGCSEICTLFLRPDYRHTSNGLLLSRARFLFMAQYPERFATTVIAEMRGISDAKGDSPFWDAVGSHFFHMSFAEADRLTLSTNKQFIADLMPRNPVYIKLLPSAAQAVLGKPHETSLAAMNILLREGFRFNHYVDIFDAGPTLEAPKTAIRSTAASRVYIVKNLIDDVCGKRFIVANTKLDFRATISQVIFNENNHCILSKETAEILEVQSGDSVRIVPLQLDENILSNKEGYDKQPAKK